MISINNDKVPFSSGWLTRSYCHSYRVFSLLKESMTVCLNRHWQNLVRRGIAVISKQTEMKSPLDNIGLVFASNKNERLLYCQWLTWSLYVALTWADFTSGSKHTVHARWQTHSAFPIICAPITSVFRARCNFPPTGSSITSCCLRTSEGPGWTDPPPHHTQDRTEQRLLSRPRLMTAEWEKEAGSCPLWSLYLKASLLLFVYCFVALGSLWTTIIKLKDWLSVTVDFSWGLGR